MKKFQKIKKQDGNALVSFGIYLFLAAVVAAWGIPKVQDYLVESKIPSIADEIQRYTARVKVSNSGSGTAPYSGLTQASFAQAVRGTALEVGTVAGQGTGGTVVRHGMGGGNDGTVVLTQTGATFTLTFSNVNLAACPGLATSLNKTFDGITINGQAVKVTATNQNVTTGYVASTASVRCADGDDNTFVFTSR